MKKYTILLLLVALSIQAQVSSPKQFLPNYGEHVTYYHQLESYFTQLTRQSDRIMQQQYGETPEERALNVYFISAPENLKALQDIRQNHLKAIGMAPATGANTTNTDKAVIWLSFNVHGNEPAAAESAMQVAYELANPQNTNAGEWLKNTIVILDPCLNPDGFAHYGNWLRSVTGFNTHPGTQDREHMEPWPGGRQNHYAFDLNRDWAWQTQPETRQRMLLYNQWMPMMHVDVHEMGYNEPYFFPPAAEPIHDFIAPFQKEFHNIIGEITSKKFDTEGWGYYTRERFDLFYPSYGDTYPCFNGAVGMTYEQGGINAGRAVKMRNGNILTLQDRIDHHTAAVLTAVETASLNKDRLVRNFRDYFRQSREKQKGKYGAYVIKDNGKNQQLAMLLKRNNIEFTYADETKKLNGYHYQSDADRDFSIQPNDIIVNVSQPKAVLTQVLFEPHQRLTDSLSYDITAWSLPLAYGVNSYALRAAPGVKTRKEVSHKGKLEFDNAYAYYIPWNSRESAVVLASLHENHIQVRSARKESAFRGLKITKGDLIVLKNDNRQHKEWENIMEVLLADKPDYEVVDSGFSVSGADLGGEYYPLLKEPKVLLLSGNGVSATDFGAAWYFMDYVLNYPVSIVDVQNFSRIDFSDFNTLILPDGWYSLDEAQRTKLSEFADSGGKIIAMGGALNLFEDAPGYSLTRFATSAEKGDREGEDEQKLLAERFLNYEGSERRAISYSVPGAIVENRLDTTHPLSYGLGEKYFSLKTSDSHYQLLKGAQNVVYVPSGYKSFGFIGRGLKKELENTVTFAVEQKGEGQIIYMVDNPLFRGFWENGNLLFSNALFLVD